MKADWVVWASDAGRPVCYPAGDPKMPLSKLGSKSRMSNGAAMLQELHGSLPHAIPARLRPMELARTELDRSRRAVYSPSELYK
jgi:hypothetical protein